MYEFIGGILIQSSTSSLDIYERDPTDTMKEAELSKVQPHPYTLQEKVEQLQK